MRSSRRHGRRLLPKLIVFGIVAAAVTGAVYGYTQRHVHRLSVRPGESKSITVEVPMQRFGRPKSFAKGIGLPVVCTVAARPSEPGGVSVSVVETGHKVHMMWARLSVSADPAAPPGRRRRSVDFEIDGQGGWPTATVIIDVQG